MLEWVAGPLLRRAGSLCVLVLAMVLVPTALQLRRTWDETPAAFAERMAAVVEDINDTCDVRGACSGFPERLLSLVRRKGDRLHT